VSTHHNIYGLKLL